MVCKQFLTNFNSGHVHDGLRDFVKATIAKKETANMTNSLNQVILVLLFQLIFYLIGQSMDVAVKFFLFAITDAMVIMVIVSEWFQQKCEWDLWVMKVCGEPKK